MTLSGSPLDYIFAFTGGVLVSFTPCVYPLIPVTVFYISSKSGNSKAKGFFLSLVFVTGLAVTYSILGLVASLSGKIFGSISTNPLTLIAVGAVVLLFGISMLLDLFNLSWQAPKADTGKKGYFSTFVLGASTGLIASPCLTPALGTILAYVSTRKNILFGMSLLMAFAYGMGLILILAGTFSGVLVSLPKSGKWMIYFKRAASIIVMALGLYLIYQGTRGL
ncbi:MAG: cytochrome c biogenesis protein CcdA [Candidatus Omnitrophota bacterium]